MISIIIPTKNEELNVLKNLKHLQRLRKSNHCEIILVDGESTDNTVNVASNLVDSIFITKPGRALQQNIGASIARGDTLLFLHADTFISEKQLLDLKKLSTRKSWGFFKIKFDNNKIKYKFLSYAINLRSKIYNYGTGDQAIYVNKDIFDQIKGFPNLMIMEDIKICSLLKNISNPHIINSYIITSSRRWEQYGFINTILKMRFLRFLYKIGIKSSILKIYYK